MKEKVYKVFFTVLEPANKYDYSGIVWQTSSIMSGVVSETVLLEMIKDNKYFILDMELKE